MMRGLQTISLMRALRLYTNFIGARHAVPLLILLLYPLAAAAAVYLTPKEALTQFFRDSETVISIKKPLSDADKAELKKRLGYALDRDSVTFYVGKTGDRIDGYALLDHQIGKTQPITFMTMINPQGKVEQIEVLVYRESHGSEVRQQRFLQQFYQKDLSAPLRRGQDIINISGATMSVNAMTIGVKRALLLWHYFFSPPT